MHNHCQIILINLIKLFPLSSCRPLSSFPNIVSHFARFFVVSLSEFFAPHFQYDDDDDELMNNSVTRLLFKRLLTLQLCHHFDIIPHRDQSFDCVQMQQPQNETANNFIPSIQVCWDIFFDGKFGI